MDVKLTYKEAKEVLHYLKAWDRVKDSSESGNIKFDQDKLKYNRSEDKVKIELLP